jgi:hypothetical protein
MQFTAMAISHSRKAEPNSKAGERTADIGEDAARDLIQRDRCHNATVRHWTSFHTSCSSKALRNRLSDVEKMDCGGRSMKRFGGAVDVICKFLKYCFFFLLGPASW